MLKEKAEKPLRESRGKYFDILYDFIESDNQTLIYDLSNIKEATYCKQSLQYTIKKRDLDLCVWKKNSSVYVIKC